MKKKQLFKKIDGKCHFCPVTGTLDTHRIIPGSEGGKYTRHNTVTVCPNHHRKIHLGEIKIVGRHLTTKGIHILHYFENDEEKWG